MRECGHPRRRPRTARFALPRYRLHFRRSVIRPTCLHRAAEFAARQPVEIVITRRQYAAFVVARRQPVVVRIVGERLRHAERLRHRHRAIESVVRHRVIAVGIGGRQQIPVRVVTERLRLNRRAARGFPRLRRRAIVGIETVFPHPSEPIRDRSDVAIFVSHIRRRFPARVDPLRHPLRVVVGPRRSVVHRVGQRDEIAHFVECKRGHAAERVGHRSAFVASVIPVIRRVVERIGDARQVPDEVVAHGAKAGECGADAIAGFRDLAERIVFDGRHAIARPRGFRRAIERIVFGRKRQRIRSARSRRHARHPTSGVAGIRRHHATRVSRTG